jgi:drug/metabolite transporter (DMT)-like permease
LRVKSNIHATAAGAASQSTTIFAAALLLGEAIDPATFVAAALVIAAIAFGRRSI